MSDIIAVDKYRLFIERIENIESDLDARKADRKAVYSELKVKVTMLKQLVRLFVSVKRKRIFGKKKI